jgi:hypothetical protein
MMKRGAEKCELQICWGIWEMKKWAVKFLRWVSSILMINHLEGKKNRIKLVIRILTDLGGWVRLISEWSPDSIHIL